MEKDKLIDEDNPNWRFWKDIKTNWVYEIDFDTSNGMSLANNPGVELVKISKYEYERRR